MRKYLHFVNILNVLTFTSVMLLLLLLLLTNTATTKAVKVSDKTHSTAKAQDKSNTKDHLFTSILPEHGLLRSFTGNGWPQCDPTVTQ